MNNSQRREGAVPIKGDPTTNDTDADPPDLMKPTGPGTQR